MTETFIVGGFPLCQSKTNESDHLIVDDVGFVQSGQNISN
jgi:hypothetical protein